MATSGKKASAVISRAIVLFAPHPVARCHTTTLLCGKCEALCRLLPSIQQQSFTSPPTFTFKRRRRGNIDGQARSCQCVTVVMVREAKMLECQKKLLPRAPGLSSSRRFPRRLLARQEPPAGQGAFAVAQKAPGP